MRSWSAHEPPPTPAAEELTVQGVVLHRLPLVQDIRGNLSAGEVPRDVPFVPQRYFLVHAVPSGETRGAHAHRVCHQYLVCVAGACSVVVDDGASRVEVRLDNPSLGLYVPNMIWAIQYKYDSLDYIRDYDEYLDALSGRAR